MSDTTLYLDPETWDVTVTASGSIAMVEAPYQLAQDAASQIRLFLGELYYDTNQGVPYWQQILGKTPPLALLKAKLRSAALLVPGVVKARVFMRQWGYDRTPTGQVQVVDAAGVLSVADF